MSSHQKIFLEHTCIKSSINIFKLLYIISKAGNYNILNSCKETWTLYQSDSSASHKNTFVSSTSSVVFLSSNFNSTFLEIAASASLPPPFCVIPVLAYLLICNWKEESGTILPQCGSRLFRIPVLRSFVPNTHGHRLQLPSCPTMDDGHPPGKE